MSRMRLAAAVFPVAVALMVPFAASADRSCARPGGDCREATTARAAPAGGWARWAAGARMRMDGWTAGPAHGFEPGAWEQPDASPLAIDRLLPAARLYPRAGYGAGMQALDPDAAASYVSYPLGESVRLDLTAGSGRRIGLRASGSDLPHGVGSGPHGLPFAQGADRTSWSVALNASRQIGAFGIGGRIGYVDVRDHADALFDASILRFGAERASLRRSFLGIDASYDIGRRWQLHGGAMVRRDEARSAMALSSVASPIAIGDRDEREWGVGVRYYGWRNFRLNLEFLKTSGRDQLGSESLLFMGRFDF